MSLRKGDNSKRGQKYCNSRAFKPGLYGVSRRVKLAATLPLGGVCTRCKEKIEWKKKYDKYKPLTAPKTCVTCHQKKVKQAYYRLCQDCAESKRVCAKCGEEREVVSSFPMSEKAQTQEEAEFRRGLKLLSERERRTLLREKGTRKETKSCTALEPNTDAASNSDSDGTESDDEGGHVTTAGDEGSSHVTKEQCPTETKVQNSLGEAENEYS